MAKGKRDRRASIRSMATEPTALDPLIWADQPEASPAGEEPTEEPSHENHDAD